MYFAAEHKTVAFLNMKYLPFNSNWINLTEVLLHVAASLTGIFSFYAFLALPFLALVVQFSTPPALFF